MTTRTQAPAPPGRPTARPGDAVSFAWVDRAPRWLKPYLRLMRLDRPIGTWLLFWPCVFGLALGAAAEGKAVPDPWYVLLCGAGAIVMRGAGCTYNDIVDRDYDARVERTRGRPIPAGEIGVAAAWIFAIAQTLIGLAILLSFNRFAIALGMASLLLIAPYPFMKRITWWPQAWLGLTFNWGVPFGYAAETGHLGAAALLFYAGCFFWTMGYDTIYAHQDKEDDRAIGVKSSALRLGNRTRPWLFIFYGLALLLMMAGGLAAGLGIAYELALSLPAAHLFRQAAFVEIESPSSCLRWFKANHASAALLAAALVIGALAHGWHAPSFAALDDGLEPNRWATSSTGRGLPL